MCIGPVGDLEGRSPGDCAVLMTTKAGADVVGVNCLFGPFIALKTMKLMKLALDNIALKPHLMCQPLGYMTPECSKHGYLELPEFYMALEPRQITRIDAERFAREAYNLGVRILGGCCGFRSYHIRSMAEELSKERNRLPESSAKTSPWCIGLKETMYFNFLRKRPYTREFWENLQPSGGRPSSAQISTSLMPSNYCVLDEDANHKSGEHNK